VSADGASRAVAFRVAPGQAQELPRAVALLARLPGVPRWVVADRGYTSRAFRSHVRELGARPAIPPPQRHEAAVACPEWIHVDRNRVERLWVRFEEWRRAVATRYERSAVSFAGVLCLAAALDRLKP
jgi:transposase